MSNPRLLLAFAVLPFVHALVMFGVLRVAWAMTNDAPYDSLETAVGFAALTGVLGAIITLVVGFPVWTWMRRRGFVSFRHVVLAGVLLGNAPFAAYVVLIGVFTILHLIGGTMGQHWMPVSDIIAGTLRAIALGSFFGLVSAVVFWPLARKGLP